MKKSLTLSIAVSSALFSGDVTLSKILIDGKEATELKQETIKNSKRIELSEILSDSVPSLSLSRTGGLGNDIILRGQQRDNISVVIDDTMVYGACPNRMDPPVMHISSDQISDVEVGEGIYNVANFGALAGSVRVKTEDPKKGFHGAISGTVGSFDYYRGSVKLEGGTDQIQIGAGYSQETSSQYVDGDGKSMAEQIADINPQMGYIDEDLDSFTRKTYWTKFVYSPLDNHKFKFSYFGDKSDDVLYPVFSMDGINDKTDIYNFEYEGIGLAQYSDFLRVKYFKSEISHDMSTKFRKSSVMMGSKTHSIESIVEGLRVENRFERGKFLTTFGLDFSDREWDGTLYDDANGQAIYTMVPDVVTQDMGFYGDFKWRGGSYDIESGIRFDSVTVDANKLDKINPFAQKTFKDDSLEYNGLSANLLGRYHISKDSSLYTGFGQSFRVPNGKELYMNKVMKDSEGKPFFSIEGNQKLNETYNREIDAGFRTKIGNSRVEFNVFYSQLTDFIYAYRNGKALSFKNIDATIHGADMRVATKFTKNLSTNFSLAFQKGEKDKAIEGQTDTDLAGIPPLKGVASVKYAESNWNVEFELIGADSQTIDEDNDEKDIDGYFTSNLKGNYSFTENLSLSVGIDNLFDEVYQVNNSYIGRGVVSTDVDNIAVLNEAGREFYINLDYKF